MNRINPKKLLHSKWTAVNPVNREKHFIVTKVIFDEDDFVEECILEAAISNRAETIDWKQLENSCKWLHGWK
jgi:tryptophan-rich hypothetical protein